ncbi:ABC transporter ATP-binding protein [Dyadobacter aurulentus]|uniref:ABC transporter ATP-binding protein n=1 Tax=Dyadobacter sp. UC 10 TaxID=2605428 RepID=UPI0011F3CC31|nr:ATP-binding cassette domain-containing protein [Dyadobacter sp. UC 10]KAA0993036.1 ATP-binding cassette domain-containing protein [Dyadobacter sp. UC 10]
MIRASHISKNYGAIEAVRDISFEVKEGETLILLGTSGCGKTTTLKMINRLIEASSGKIEIDDRNVFEQDLQTLRRTIGYVSQNNGLFPHFTVRENIGIVPKLLKWEKSATSRHTDRLLEQLKLPVGEFAGKFPDELSGGQKQRVAIARALIADPPVLLMDEPFGALDPVTRTNLRQEFQNLPELKSKTIVLVTHDVQEAFELGDQICIMDKGQIIQSGSAGDLLFNPVNKFVSTFFDHQRLLLELNAITFRDIWMTLPKTCIAGQAAISADESLWKGMQVMIESGLEELVVADAEDARIARQSAIFQAVNLQHAAR